MTMKVGCNEKAIARNIARAIKDDPKKVEQLEKMKSICAHLTSDDGITVRAEMYGGNIVRYLITGTRCNMTVTVDTMTNRIIRKPRNIIAWCYAETNNMNVSDIMKEMENLGTWKLSDNMLDTIEAENKEVAEKYDYVFEDLKAIEVRKNQFGLRACMESVEFQIETLHNDPVEMMKDFRHRAETDVFFNKTMITALEQYMEEHGIAEEPEEPEDIPQTEEEQDERSDLQRECDAVVTELTNVYEGRLIADEDGCVDGVDFGLCEGDTVSMWDLFSHEDVYDIEYMIGGDGDYRGVRLMVACGGPNVYINTQRREVEGYWSLDSATAWLPSEICEEIDGVWEEYYSMMLG